MIEENRPVAVVAAEVAPRTRPSNYPEPFASRMAGRLKRQLGDVFFAAVGTEHVAHPIGEAGFLVVERAGSA